jgi:hypothetical protein
MYGTNFREMAYSNKDGFLKSTDNAFNVNVDNLYVLQNLQLSGSGSGSLSLSATAISSPYTWKYPATVGTAGQVLTSQAGGTMTWTTVSGGGGSGTVTSVGMTVPSFLAVSPSTITSSGTFALSLSGTALPVLNGGTGTTTSTGIGSVVLNSSPSFVTGSGNVVTLFPASTNTECAILFNSQTTNTGARWVAGQNVATSGADTFALYSTTLNNKAIVVDNAGNSFFYRKILLNNGAAIDGGALEICPGITDSECSMLYFTGTNRTGNYWITGINIASVGANTYSIYSSTFGKAAVWFNSAGQATFNGQIYSNGTLTSGTRYHSLFYSGATQTGRITDNGSTVTYFSASDYRIKSDIQPIKNPLTKLLQLKPCTYTFTETQQPGEGFIAHEIQEIIPTAVSGHKDEIDQENNPVIQGVDYSKLTPLLTAAVQELTAIVQQQQQTIAQILATMNM